MENILNNIKAIRKNRKLSTQYMAKELGIDASNYNRMENGESSLTLERLYQIAGVFDMEPEDIMTYGKEGNVTYVPVNVRAGGLAEYMDNCPSCTTFNFPLLNEEGLKIINVDGDSMYPTLSHGDNVFIKQEEVPVRIKWGEPYVIDAIDGRIIKRIYQHPDDKAKLILKSDNSVYEPYEIDLNDVLSMWRVKAKFSKNLSPVR